MGRRRRRRRRGFFRRVGRSFRRVFRRRRRRRRAPAPPKKQVVLTQKSAPKPPNLKLGTTTKMSSKELKMLANRQCMGRWSVPGNDGNLLLDTTKDSRIGKWYPGEYRVTIKEGNNYGQTTFKILEDGQAVVNYKPGDTSVNVFLNGGIKDTPDIEPPTPLPESPKMPGPPLPKFNQPDNTSAPLGERYGSWKTIVTKTSKTEWPLFPPNKKMDYNKKYIFRIVPYEKAPDYLWIKRFLGNPDHYEGFGNDIEIQTPSPPLGIERGDSVFHTKVDKVDTVWSSYEGAAKYFISKKPTKGYILLTDLKVNDITDVPIIREDFERNMPGLPKGYTGGKAGEVDLDLYDSVEDVVFKDKGDSGTAGEVPVSPNVLRWALPTTYQHPTLFNLEKEEYYGAESLGLSGTAGAADEWDYLVGSSNDRDEAKAFKRFRKRHPKRIFRRIMRQQDTAIKKIELKRGKLPRSVRRNIKKSMVRKRMMLRIGALEKRRGIRWKRTKSKNRWKPLWKRGRQKFNPSMGIFGPTMRRRRRRRRR